MGRIIGQDILIRRMLFHLMGLQLAVTTRDPSQIWKQADDMRQWLKEASETVDNLDFTGPDAERVRDAAKASLGINIGDIIDGLERMKPTHN